MDPGRYRLWRPTRGYRLVTWSTSPSDSADPVWCGRRGALSGGYELARSPEDITVADVLRAIGEGVIPADCGAAGNCYYHDRLDECVTRPIWQDIQSQVEESLSRVTLATVAKRVGANLDAERVRGDGSS